MFPWERLEGTEAPPGFIRYEPVGYELQEGRWLIAVALAGLFWTIVYTRSRNLYIALAALGLASGGIGVSITAIGEYGFDAVEPLIASAAWFAAALLVLWLQWWEDGRSCLVVMEIFGDFEFDHFLTTGFVGLLWALALASSVVGVFVAAIEVGHDESVVIGLVAGGVTVLGSIVWLLLVRLLLETVVVLFRIYGEIYFGNARALRSEMENQQSAGATSAPGPARISS